MSASYNGVDFIYPLTTIHTYGPSKDPSNSDQLYTETVFGVESLLNIALLPAKVTDTGPANIVDRIRHYLTQPRADFYYDYTSLPGQKGPNPVFDISGRDDATGPWPNDKALSIIYTTPDTLLIKWEVTFKLRYCGDANSVSAPLSLRWEDRLSWDMTWKATYKRNGTLIISSKDIHDADWYRRNKISPPVPAGFRRTSADYVLSRDGLRADFTFSDEQVRFAPPGVGVDMRIVQSETAPIGPIRKGNISVRITGIQNANVIDTARWALVIMYSRLLAAKPLLVVVGGSTSMPGQINLETIEDVGGVEVAASCSYKTQPDKGQQVGVMGAAAAAWAAAVPAPQFQLVNGRLTQQGNPSAPPLFPWVGAGTTPASRTNPGGFASWANPTAAVGGPADGVGLATAVGLFAALLNDPCGNQLVAVSDAQPVTNELRTTPANYNSPTGGGQGGTPPEQNSQLTASVGSLNAAQYPQTISLEAASALWADDGLPGVYDYWQTNDEYADDPGRMVVPVCRPDGINARIDYSSQMFALYRKWTAKRTGAPPRLPPQVVNTPDGNADPNWVYVGGNPAPAVRELGLASDGVNIVYEASGIYTFQALDGAKVAPAAQIPPFFDAAVGRSVAGWINGAQLIADGELPGGADGALFGFGISVSSPLGNATLTFTINP